MYILYIMVEENLGIPFRQKKMKKGTLDSKKAVYKLTEIRQV